MSRTYRKGPSRVARQCPQTGKKSFRSTTAARQFIETRDYWRGEIARVYHCPSCLWFHLTSKPTLWERRRNAQSA